METILAKNSWKYDRAITKKDLINPKYECNIFINENKLIDNMVIKGENIITYIFNNYYENISDLFCHCTSLTSINLSNLNTSKVT